MDNQEAELRVIRDQIDSIDLSIQQLLNQRAKCAQQVAEVKMKYQQGDVPPVYYRPEREAQVLRRVMERNEGPLPAPEVARLFREIMSVCLAFESPLNVAFLGPEGTFTQQAVHKAFGHSAVCAPQGSLEDVFREVQSGQVHYGVVPIENSSEGVASHTLDLFSRFDVMICGEVELVTHHHLLSRSEAAGSIKKVYAHAQSLAQCAGWLETHLPEAERVMVSSNGEAARLAAEGGAGVAAIAGAMAAELYELHVVSTNIEDHKDVSTRFLVISTQHVSPSGRDKTSVLLTTTNRPGALYGLLQPFYEQCISLTRIETRPAGKLSRFYIDFEGHQDDPKIQVILDQLTQQTQSIKLLGSYPVAVL